MKRILVILFSFLYLFLASGFSTYQHLCKGLVQQTSVAFAQTTEESCAFCSQAGKTVDEPKKNCCQDKVEVVKVKSEVQQTMQQRVSVLNTSLESIQVMFGLDKASYLEVVHAQSLALQSNLNYATLKRDYLASKIDLYRALGGH